MLIVTYHLKLFYLQVVHIVNVIIIISLFSKVSILIIIFSVIFIMNVFFPDKLYQYLVYSFFEFQEIKREAITPRNEDNKNFSKDLSCDAILDTDNFFGPEMFVTSGDQCYASLFP